PALMGTVLPVDVAISSEGLIAIANAGLRDPATPQPFVRTRDEAGGFHRAEGISRPAPELSQGVVLAGARLLSRDVGGCGGGETFVPIADPVVAVAFTPGPSPLLVAQTREPARIHVFDRSTGIVEAIELGGEPRLDTGHELFHRDTGAGI